MLGMILYLWRRMLLASVQHKQALLKVIQRRLVQLHVTVQPTEAGRNDSECGVLDRLCEASGIANLKGLLEPGPTATRFLRSHLSREPFELATQIGQHGWAIGLICSRIAHGQRMGMWGSYANGSGAH